MVGSPSLPQQEGMVLIRARIVEGPRFLARVACLVPPAIGGNHLGRVPLLVVLEFAFRVHSCGTAPIALGGRSFLIGPPLYRD